MPKASYRSPGTLSPGRYVLDGSAAAQALNRNAGDGYLAVVGIGTGAAAVPEPGTLVMIGLALVGLGLYQCRRIKATLPDQS